MSPRPTPPHGSEARYKGSKYRPACRCRTCITGWSRAGQKRLLGRLEGRPATVPAAPITAHLRRLAAAGMSPTQIAALSGVNVTTVRDHIAGIFPSLRRTTADKILAVNPGQKPAEGWVSPLGAVRRCRALYTLGHGPRAIAAAHPDLQLRTVEYVIGGRRQFITVALHNAIRDAYRTLSQVSGTSSQAKQRAAKEGWAGPLDWDNIDDPREQPDTDDAAAVIRRHKAVVDPQRVATLTAIGRTNEQIAAELGCHERTVSRVRRRAEQQLAA